MDDQALKKIWPAMPKTLLSNTQIIALKVGARQSGSIGQLRARSDFLLNHFQILWCENRKYLDTVLASDQPPARIMAARS